MPAGRQAPAPQGPADTRLAQGDGAPICADTVTGILVPSADRRPLSSSRRAPHGWSALRSAFHSASLPCSASPPAKPQLARRRFYSSERTPPQLERGHCGHIVRTWTCDHRDEVHSGHGQARTGVPVTSPDAVSFAKRMGGFQTPSPSAPRFRGTRIPAKHSGCLVPRGIPQGIASRALSPRTAPCSPGTPGPRRAAYNGRPLRTNIQRTRR